MPSDGFGTTLNDGAFVRFLGAKVYYKDGTVGVKNLLADNTCPDWSDGSSADVVCVCPYYDRTHQKNSGGALVTANYKKTYTQEEYYWFSPTQGFGAGPAADAPADAINKTDATYTEPEFYSRWGPAYEALAYA